MYFTEAAEVMYEICAAVKHIHDMNIAHRDLKPENLLYSKPGKYHIFFHDIKLQSQFLLSDNLENLYHFGIFYDALFYIRYLLNLENYYTKLCSCTYVLHTKISTK